MFYAFVFQDSLCFGIIGKDGMVGLAEAIENCIWAEFEAL